MIVSACMTDEVPRKVYFRLTFRHFIDGKLTEIDLLGVRAESDFQIAEEVLPDLRLAETP